MRIPLRVFELAAGGAAFGLVGEVDSYESAYFTRSWSGVGAFEIEGKLASRGMDELTVGRIIMLGRDERRSGIILSRKRTREGGGKGGERVVAKGVELKGILGQRVVLPPSGAARWYQAGTAETVMRALVSDQIVNATDTKRRMPILALEADQGRGTAYALASRYGNVGDCLEKASAATGLGYWIELDLGFYRFTLRFGTGLDRSAVQSTNGRAIFAAEYDTLDSAEVEETLESYANLAVVGGQGQGTARTIATATQEASEPEGLARRELWIDARDLASAGDLPGRGLAKLAENGTLILDGKALTNSPLVYGRDYDLGDVVTLAAFGEAWDARITEVREAWGRDGYSVEPTFGPPAPELPEQVRRALAGQADALNDSETA